MSTETTANVASDCDKAAEFYEEKPGMISAFTTVDLYRTIARLARIIESLVNENDALKAAGLKQPLTGGEK